MNISIYIRMCLGALNATICMCMFL